MKKYQTNFKLSFVIPVFNEQEAIEELYLKIKEVARKNQKYTPYEVIFINDGSTDNTLKILQKLSLKNHDLKIISFRKNLGKAAALNQGFQKASGEIVITMDGDLQDGPENLPDLLQKISQGFDLVVGWKKKRKDPIGKRFPSLAFNFTVRYFSQLPLHDFNSGLKAMKLEVGKELYLYGELHRFIPVLASQRGFKVAEIAVTHHPRKYGVSKYGWTRLFTGFIDFLTVMFLGSFNTRPLHLFGLLGFFCVFLGTVFGVYLTVLHFQGYAIARRPLLTLSVLLIIAGLQMLLSGLIAEMIVSRRASVGENLPIDYET